VSKSLTNIGIVATATMVSRVLGLVRDMLVTAVFGMSALASAFYTAFTLPNLFRRLLGEGALTAAFVPTLNEELRHRHRAGAHALLNQVASWLFLVTGTLVGGSMLVLSVLVPRWVRGRSGEFDPGTIERWLAAADLSVVLFPYLVFACLAAAFSATLQTLQRFLEPALSPIWLNLAMIGLLGAAVFGGWATLDEARMRWLCAGALLGGFLQMAVPAMALMRDGWRPRFDLTLSDPLRRIIRLMGPTVFGSAIYLINLAVSRFLGLSLNESAVAILNLTTRLLELPIGVFAVAVSTVVFPLIAQHAAAGDLAGLALAYRKGMRLVLAFNVPAAVGMLVLATPIVRLLFERGAFDAGDTALTLPVLAVFALGLPFFAFVNIMLRAFYAQRDTATPVRAAFVSFLVNLGLSLALMRPLGTVGLALASNLAIIVQAVHLQCCLTRKHPGLGFRHVMADVLKIVAASIVMGLAVAAGWWGWSRAVPTTKWSDALALAGLIGGGAGLYAAILWRLRIEGRDDLAAVFAKLRARFR